MTGRLTYRERKKLPSYEFAIPSKREYPIYNANHARNALARVSAYGTEYQKRMVCEAVARRYPEIHEKSCHMH
jgi:N-acetyl-anhydromuramyl-L-alanine amidase AmpD